jgi:spoIIIJ-associated protein
MGIAAVVSIESDEPVSLTIESSDSALLIGKKGDHLRAFQQVVNTVYRRKFEAAGFISIDIAGYKKDRIERVQAIAQETAEKVREDGKTIHLKPMNSFERRHIHTLLADEVDIVTESEGEGMNRHVVVKLRS